MLYSVLATLLSLGAPTPPLSPSVVARVEITDAAAQPGAADNSNAALWLVPIPRTDLRQIVVSEAPHFRLIQKNKRFAPHVLVVPIGSVVEFPNLDPFFHNVFSLFEGRRFDLGLYESGSSRSVSFNKAGVCYIFCNIHPDMSAAIVVVATSYYGLSDRTGEITVSNVPPGRYEVHVWHERCAADGRQDLPREISVGSQDVSLGVLRLQASSYVVTRHKNKYGRDYDRAAPASPLYDQAQ